MNRPAHLWSRATAIGTALAAFAAGCEPSAPSYPVSGSVQLNGKPLPAGSVGNVSFYDPTGATPMTHAEILPGGRFEFPPPGLPAAEYRVTVIAYTPGQGIEGKDKDYRPSVQITATRYQAVIDTPLSVRVQAGPNDFPLSLAP